jgi:hypothetical protein
LHAVREGFVVRVLPAGNVDDVPYRLVCTLRADFLRPLLEHADVGPRLLPRSPMGVATLERSVGRGARPGCSGWGCGRGVGPPPADDRRLMSNGG